ncbi:MAG TPA: 2-phospho-L-lactate guanylyltransferase [Acidimicrobiia bacterium]|nr:2-phospho-L-lactate guanylyltransferase [Acidimicrobiia bacterium]
MAMQCALVIPVRSFADAKTRLASTLNPTQREELMRNCVSRVIAAGQNTTYIQEIVLVSADKHVKHFAQLASVNFFSSDVSLNEDLNACVYGLNLSLDGIIISHGDLPWITTFDDVHEYLLHHQIVIAPDRHRKGTNIYAHNREVSAQYEFGADSLSKHIRNIRATRMSYTLIQSPEYGLDIDTPHDHKFVNEKGQ